MNATPVTPTIVDGVAIKPFTPQNGRAAIHASDNPASRAYKSSIGIGLAK